MDFGCVISTVGVNLLTPFFISEQLQNISRWTMRQSALNMSYVDHHSETFLE